MPSINSLDWHGAMPPTDSSVDNTSGPYLELDIKEIEKELLDKIETLKLQVENDSITSSLL